MITQHKKKAVIGLTLWCATTLLFSVAVVVHRLSHGANSRGIWGAVAFLSFAGQYFTFFWGGSHLARGKGQSTGMLVVGVLWVTQFMILGVLLFGLPDRYGRPSAPVKKPRRHESSIARVVRYRKNALVFNCLGGAGVLLALACEFMPFLFALDPETARIVGLFVFVAGYAGIICGCWWWVRAKNWVETVVFIGVSPLVVLFIPWVRLIYFIPGVCS